MKLIRLAMATAGLALAGVAVGAGIFWAMRKPVRLSPVPVPIEIGTVSLRIPADYFRAGALPRPGAQDRVDLALAFPGLVAASGGKDNGARKVFVALLREDGVLDPAERVTDIYGRFMEPEIWRNPGGLLLRRFTAESPYGDEELFFNPPDGRVFAARCRKPAARSDGDGARFVDGGETCLWRFRTDGVDVQVRFSPELLPQWDILEVGLRTKVAAWRRG